MYDNNSKGWVYFFQCETTRRIKIGWARHPECRLQDIKGMSPTQISIAAAYRGTPVDEKRAHEKFATYRLHGEWFNPSDELLTEIGRVIEVHGEKPWVPVYDLPPAPPKPGEDGWEDYWFGIRLKLLENIRAGVYRWGKNDLRLYGDVLFGLKEAEIPYDVEWSRP